MKVLTKELYYRLQIIFEITCNTSDIKKSYYLLQIIPNFVISCSISDK